MKNLESKEQFPPEDEVNDAIVVAALIKGGEKPMKGSGVNFEKPGQRPSGKELTEKAEKREGALEDRYKGEMRTVTRLLEEAKKVRADHKGKYDDVVKIYEELSDLGYGNTFEVIDAIRKKDLGKSLIDRIMFAGGPGLAIHAGIFRAAAESLKK